MVLQLRAGREQKAWQPFWDWHLVSSLPPSFVLDSLCSFPSFHPSLFNWLCVKVLLSASTCPCHSKQRRRGDAAASLLSPASARSSAFFSNFLLFCLFFVFAPLPFPSLAGLPPLFVTQVSSLVSLALSRPCSYSFRCFCLRSWPGDKRKSSLPLFCGFLFSTFVPFLSQWANRIAR